MGILLTMFSEADSADGVVEVKVSHHKYAGKPSIVTIDLRNNHGNLCVHLPSLNAALQLGNAIMKQAAELIGGTTVAAAGPCALSYAHDPHDYCNGEPKPIPPKVQNVVAVE